MIEQLSFLGTKMAIEKEATNMTLWIGDCLELMRNIPDKSLDAIITDLPYGTTDCSWDAIIPIDSMWNQIKRILKKSGAFITTSSQPFSSILVASNIRDFKVEWIWRKKRWKQFRNL